MASASTSSHDDNPAENMEVQFFQFHIKLGQFLNDYLNRFDTDGNEKSVTATFKDLIVGDRHVVFDAVLSASPGEEGKMSVKLIRTSQKALTVYVHDCRVFCDMGMSMEFEPTELVIGSINPYYSTIDLNADIWEMTNFTLFVDLAAEVDRDVAEILSLWISGKISYKKPTTIQQELTILLNNEETSDVEIIVGDRKFVSHKWLLGAKSSFFRAMFSSNFQECINNIVKLPTDDPAIFEQIMIYIYTGTCPKLSTNMVLDIFIMADKYDIRGLQEICEIQMRGTITIENVCDFMTTSKIINSKQFHDQCLKFYKKNKADILKTNGYKKLERNPDYRQIIKNYMYW